QMGPRGVNVVEVSRIEIADAIDPVDPENPPAGRDPGGRRSPGADATNRDHDEDVTRDRRAPRISAARGALDERDPLSEVGEGLGNRPEPRRHLEHTRRDTLVPPRRALLPTHELEDDVERQAIACRRRSGPAPRCRHLPSAAQDAPADTTEGPKPGEARFRSQAK